MRLSFYIWYKLLNSLFLGLSTGAIFVLYAPLEPSIYSIGGIVLAICMMGVAKLYDKMMNYKIFYLVCMCVEVVMLLMIVTFLFCEFSYMVALFVYISYQITFIFGGYLVRVETVMLHRVKILSIVDVVKQKGYIIGLFIAYILYKISEYFGVTQKLEQVYILHVVLFLLQLCVVYLVYRSFKR